MTVRAWGLGRLLGTMLVLWSSGGVEASELNPAAVQPTRPEETADAVLNAEQQSWNRHLHDVLGLPGWLDLAVDHRTRFEALEGPFRPGEPRRQSQWPQRTRVRLGFETGGPVRFLAEVQDARTSGVGPGDFVGGQVDELDVLQLLVTATGRDLFGNGLRGDVHVGRMTLDVGSRRLVARNRTRNTTNSFDGVHLQLGGADLDWRVRAFRARPVNRQTGTFDDESSSQRVVSGLVFETGRWRAFDLDAYWLGLDDDLLDRTIQTLGIRIWRQSKASRFDFEMEWMQQSGDSRGLDHRAHAVHAELGYSFGGSWAPRLVGQFDLAQGDGDATDDESNTFDPLLGARRFDLVATGIYGPFRRANIVSPGVRLLLKPAADWKLQVKARSWQLEEARGAFAGNGLQDATGAAGNDLGFDVEIRVQWDPKSWFGLDAGYGHWFKGSYLDRVDGAASAEDSDYIYLAPRVRF